MGLASLKALQPLLSDPMGLQPGSPGTSGLIAGLQVQIELVPQVDLAHLWVSDQLGGVSVTKDLAAKDDVGPVSALQGLTHIVVGDQDPQTLLAQAIYQGLYFLHVDRIDSGKGLVQQQYLGFGGQGTGKFQAAPFSSREDFSEVVFQVLKLKFSHEPMGFGEALLARDGHGLQYRQQVVAYGHLAKNTCLLGKVSHSHSRSAVHGGLAAVDSADAHLARVWHDQANGHAKAGGLARSIGTQQADDFSRVDLEADPVHHPSPTIALGQAIDFQQGSFHAGRV